jgi:simple sugar transport system permease protein
MTWGGVGPIGALTVSFIQSGGVAAGLSGFYVRIFNGLIIILSQLGHRWNQKRFRQSWKSTDRPHAGCRG